MPKKHGFHKKNKNRTKDRRRSERLDKKNRLSLKDHVLSLIAQSSTPININKIFSNLEKAGKSPRRIKESLNSLEKSEKIALKDNCYSLTAKSGFLQATLDVTAQGLGFASVIGARPGDKDVFIGRSQISDASHGDTVLLEIIGHSRGRREGRIIKVLTRGVTRLCGIYSPAGKIGFITPDNHKLPYTVMVRKNNALDATEGVVVLADIIDFGSENRQPEGKILEILGDPYDVRVQLRMAIEQFQLPRKFSTQVLDEAESLTPPTQCDKHRKDLRHIDHVTIDGITAKDFDDAIAVEEDKGGFTLYVSIADVSHYVTPGCDIDKEAYRRGTSVYLPDMVLPMLPERLSNNLCSLVPNEDRPAFTAILRFDKKGNRTGERYTKSLINSKQRFTYETVHRILYLGDEESRDYSNLMGMLTNAKKLAALLQQQRTERGSIGFNIPESIIALKDDMVSSISKAERNQAHLLIEEFMLAANEAVAETLDKSHRSVLYRIHENPDPNKVEQFIETAGALGLQLPKTDNSPAWFANIVEKQKDSPAEYVVNNLLLRTMQQARYAPENIGHFGLAARHYLHFTSPIRRYPDLVAHRVLQTMLTNQENTMLPDPATSLTDAGVYLSARERIAIDVERNVQARLSVLFLRDRVGDEFPAVISGVSSFGLFVELTDFALSGLVPVTELRDDYYVHDAKGHKLVGDMTLKQYRLGDLVTARLERVDILSKRLTFSLVDVKKEDHNEKIQK
ncbi:MAG: ribonuclease R [Desulfobulbaceae bacterium]|nr:ribonuclease R [Desulfobulbaceae bacterium]